MTNKILIVGTCFKDKNAVITQAELLFDALVKRKYNVSIVSKHRNYFRRILETMLAILTLSKNDIVILQVYGTKSVYLEVIVAFLSKLKGCIILSTLHGGLIPDMYRQSRIKRHAFKLIFRESKAITVPSNFMKSRLPGPLKDAIFIRNMLPFERPVNENENGQGSGLNILWMRAFHEVYNPLKAIEVCRLIRQKGVAVKMYMAGPDMGLLELSMREIATHQLTDHISVYPKLSQSEIDEVASLCSVYLCTNDVDNAPVTFIEMMARGVPVVSTNVGGIPYMVKDKFNALLSEHNSAEELSVLILELFNNHELRKALIYNGKKEAEKYSPSEVAKNWVELLNAYQTTPL